MRNIPGNEMYVQGLLENYWDSPCYFFLVTDFVWYIIIDEIECSKPNSILLILDLQTRIFRSSTLTRSRSMRGSLYGGRVGPDPPPPLKNQIS